MILVFIILGIIILICLVAFLLMLSTIKLEVKKLYISNLEKELQVDFVLQIALAVFNKIRLIKMTIDNDKVKKILKSGKIDVQKLKDNRALNKDVMKSLKYVKPNIEYLNIEGYFATFNTVFTSSIYGILHAILPILIAPKLKGKYQNDLKFLNLNQNIININLSCIISIKMVNIINIIYDLKKKGGRGKYGKSSDRRSYAYSNE